MSNGVMGIVIALFGMILLAVFWVIYLIRLVVNDDEFHERLREIQRLREEKRRQEEEKRRRRREAMQEEKPANPTAAMAQALGGGSAEGAKEDSSGEADKGEDASHPSEGSGEAEEASAKNETDREA